MAGSGFTNGDRRDLVRRPRSSGAERLADAVALFSLRAQQIC